MFKADFSIFDYNENTSTEELKQKLDTGLQAHIKAIEALLAALDRNVLLKYAFFDKRSEKTRKGKPQANPMPASLSIVFDEAKDSDVNDTLDQVEELETNDSVKNSAVNETQQIQTEQQANAQSQGDAKENKKEKQEGNKPRRKPIPAVFPREDVFHDLPDDQKICSCGCQLSKIGEVTMEQLEIIPMQVKVLRNIRLKYACKSCTEGVKTAKMPLQPIPKSFAAPGLLAHVAVAKFDDHLPLYRQSEMWRRFDVDLPRSTLSAWVLKMGDLLTPLVDLLQQHICQTDYVQADETTVHVLQTHDKNNSKRTKSYMWLYKTGAVLNPAIVYQYQMSRDGDHAKTFLKGFKGTLQTDGYSGYHCVTAQEGVTAMGCWAHARRKFKDVQKILMGSNADLSAELSKLDKTTNSISTTKPSSTANISSLALDKINSLYAIEKKLKEEKASAQEVFKVRQKESRPILDELHKWLLEIRSAVYPKGKLDEAVTYILNQWGSLITYIDDGCIEIDNNASERHIRPFAIGRKNWLFMGHPNGAKAGAVLYSLIETAKANGVNPEHYLAYVLKEIPLKGTDGLKELLPWNVPLPKDFITEKKENDDDEE